MLWEKVHIESLAYDLSDRVVTSAEIEEQVAGTLDRLGVARGSLERIAGVKARRWYDPELPPSVAATRAARRALSQAGIEPSDLDILINASITNDYDEPATATLIGGNLGVPHSCFTYDTTHACLGFVTAMVQAANFIELGQARHVLVVSGENPVSPLMTDIETLKNSEVTEAQFRNIFATLTLGSGAAAMVLSAADVSRTTHRLKGAVLRSANEHNQLCTATFGGGMRADTKGLLVHGAGLLIEAFPSAATEFGWEQNDDIDQFICHQVSFAHFQRVLETLGQDLDKVYLTLPYLGNTASASIPLTLAKAVEDGTVTEGDELCFYGAGSGLGAIIMSVRW